MNDTTRAAQPKHRPEDYHHIAAWGRVMASFPYYIRDEQERAAEANAPLNAIHRPKAEGEPWSTADEIQNEELRERVNRWAEEHREARSKAQAR